MANEILPYIEMCQREGVSLQRGMNYELGGNYSVILMSVRPGAPHADRFEEDGSIDQPEFTPTGHPTENGKFHSAAQQFKSGHRQPERIRVYEKIKQAICMVSLWPKGSMSAREVCLMIKTHASLPPAKHIIHLFCGLARQSALI